MLRRTALGLLGLACCCPLLLLWLPPGRAVAGMLLAFGLGKLALGCDACLHPPCGPDGRPGALRWPWAAFKLLAGLLAVAMAVLLWGRPDALAQTF